MFGKHTLWNSQIMLRHNYKVFSINRIRLTESRVHTDRILDFANVVKSDTENGVI